ncbi:MAG: TlpA family protein disulfide reductase [Planctomycetes bacterium]|nr:TlpA family protein disulfide reductase [Planctomycetota bacterium]
MIRTLAAFAALLTLQLLPAQDTLDALQRTFRTEMQTLSAGSPSMERVQALMTDQAKRLRAFVAGPAKGDDRWNGRLMLADIELGRGDRNSAQQALESIDPAEAPAMVLTSAAVMAQGIGLTALRDRLVQTAAGKPAPFEDRMAMAHLLATVLREVPRSDAIYDAALQDAVDDEQRALVRWHRADAMRDREDLPEDAAFTAMEQLAKDLPTTYWGSVAKDRLRASQLTIGDPGIDFTGRTLDGQIWTLSNHRGSAVVLAFWSAGDFDAPNLVALLAEQQKLHPDLLVVGVCLDRDLGGIRDAVKKLGVRFPVLGEGKGTQCDAALRWFVEGPTVQVLDKAGRVAALGQHAGTADGRADLVAAIEQALR